MKAILLAAAFSALTLPALSQTITDPVAGHDGVTYFDLLKKVIPDLALAEGGATGHLPEGISHLEGDDMAGELPDPATATYVQTATVMAGGKPTLWVLADLGDGGNVGPYTLLAVFDDSPTPKLLDAVEVDTDQLTGFADGPFAISDDDEAMMVGSGHSNSSQTYQSTILAHLYEGKLQRIASFFTLGVVSCDVWQTEELSVAAAPDSNDYWSIDATVVRRKALAGQECEDPAETDWRHREFIATYVWDSSEQHYVVARDDLSDLAEQDSALF